MGSAAAPAAPSVPGAARSSELPPSEGSRRGQHKDERDAQCETLVSAVLGTEKPFRKKGIFFHTAMARFINLNSVRE